MDFVFQTGPTQKTLQM